MIVKCSANVGNYDGREVPYDELLITGDRHTLSIRKYPKNTSIVMWENCDKIGTKVSLKVPNNKFDFYCHATDVVSNFDTSLDDKTIDKVIRKWVDLVNQTSF